MLLAVDLGNTNITFGLYRQSELVACFRAETKLDLNVDDYGALLSETLARSSLRGGEVEASIISSVVPALTDVLSAAISKCCAHLDQGQPLVVGRSVHVDMPVRYDNPAELGSDRLVNAVAGYHAVRNAVIVVDFGTATKFDCVSAAGEYLGGAIAPGIRVSLDALLQQTAKLRSIELEPPRHSIGGSTIESMQSGLIYGHAALVDGLVDRLRNELGSNAAVIGTGGLASLVAPHTRVIEHVDEHLTLEGLRLVYRRTES